MELIMMFGALAVAAWMAAGMTTVLGTAEEIKHAHARTPTDLLAFGLIVTGIVSAAMMCTMIMLA
jgi:ABC-type enterochelin transport system permease subunit